MASIVTIDIEGTICDKLAILPEVDPAEGRRISYQAFFTVAPEHEGCSRILRHGTAEAVLTYTNHPFGYNVELTGPKVADVKIVLYHIRQLVGYTTEYVLPFGITVQNTTFVQRLIWFLSGKLPV